MTAIHSRFGEDPAEPGSLRQSWRRLYPFESHWLELDSLRYHYLDEGGGDPLLMVHGNPTWSFYWRNLVLGLSDIGRPIVPDHIGCGLSDKPQVYEYTLSRHVSNLVKLIRHLDLQRVTLLAHDWGGAIGLGAALAEPDRFARLILFNTGAFPPPYVPWRIRACRLPLVGPVAVRGFNLFARAALSMATEKPERLTAEIQEGLLYPYDSWSNRVGVASFVRDIPVSNTHPTWSTLHDMEQALPTLSDRPVHLIWGMKDWCFRPECLDRLQELFPEAETNRIQDAGHYVIEDAHERITPLVRAALGQEIYG